MRTIYRALNEQLVPAAERIKLRLPSMTTLEDNHKTAGSTSHRITVAGALPVSLRNYERGATQVSPHAAPAGLAVGVHEGFKRLVPNDNFSDLEKQFNRVSSLAQMVERPGFRTICDRLGVAAVSLEQGKARAAAILYASPDDLAARSEEMCEEGLIGIRFVEVTDSQRDLHDPLDYLANGTVPVHNDGIRSVAEAIPWCALSSDTAKGLCAMAEFLKDPELWDDPADARATFKGRLEGLNLAGIMDIVTNGQRSEVAKDINADTIRLEDEEYGHIGLQEVVDGVYGQLGIPVPAAE